MNLEFRARRAAAHLRAAVAERPVTAAAPRPHRRAPRVLLAAGSAVAMTVVGFAVLRDSDPDRDQSVAALDRPGSTAGPASPLEGGDLPAGWTRCTDPAQRYSVGHPDRWYAISELPKDAVDARVEVGPCRFFDPRPFEIADGTEWPTTALEVSADDGAYQERSKNVEDPHDHERILLWESETVQGRSAVRVERVSTGKGLYPEGFRHYGWIIDRDGQAFTVGGFWWPQDPITNSEQKAVVDRAVQTLRFDPAADSAGRTSPVIPVDIATLPAVGMALTGGGDPGETSDDELVLVGFDGAELGRVPLDGWSGNPETGVDVIPVEGGVVLASAPAIDDPVPGCEAPHGGGGLRVAVCPALTVEGGATEIRRVGADGTTVVVAGPVDKGAGHWRFALPSPDGKWLLAQWSGECEVPSAFLIEVASGRRKPVAGAETFESWAFGWAPDGRAAVSLGSGPCGASDDRPGTYLLDPSTGKRQRLHAYNHMNYGYRFRNWQGYRPNRLERLIDRARTELGLEGCCGEPNQGGESTADGFVLDGHQIEVWAQPLAVPAEAARSRELQVVCGQARYTLSEFDVARPDRRLLQRAADLLLGRLYCTRAG